MPSPLRRAARLLALAAVAAGLAGCSVSLPDDDRGDLHLDQVRLPDGFSIDVYADQLDEARSMAYADGGTLFVGRRDGGRVSALRDTTGDHRADVVYTVDAGLNTPNGVALHEGDLYVAEISRILRYDDIEANLASPPEPTVVVDGLPEETHHGWKYIAFGPDGKLYVPVGAPCNICNPDPPFATILRMNPDGTEREVVARGVRNSVGFDWHPETEALWFTDNGRDWMGDDRPPCELNRVSEPGQHFGYPFVHGADLLDPEFGSGKDPADYTAPVQELGPHVAPLGMEFYTGAMFPEAYRGQVLIAEHGSWNRSDKIGYRVTLVRLDETREAAAYEPFARGWLQGESNWGRPVDLEQLPDGSLLVSDDQTGAIYRISYAR
jgi:glucose/arabinose dehydrogenase